MKTFIVGVNEIQYATISIQADNEKEALKKADKYLEEYGIDDSCKVFEREYDAVLAEEVL